MHELIERLLNKCGIKSIDELKGEERQTLDSWLSVLNKPEPTIADVAKLLQQERDRAQEAWRSYENSPNKDLYYKAYTRILDVIHAIITSPDKQRNEAKAQIEQLLKL